jgi:hypothetical protein
MKKSTTYNRAIFIVMLIMIASCVYSQSFFPVRGSGMSIDKKYDVSDFHGIKVSSGFDVILIQGNSELLTLTAQENLFDYITVKVDNGILNIYARNNIMATQPLKARITFRSIDELNVSGGGDVVSETPINVGELGVYISGGGDFSSVINSGEVKCHISGGGDAEIKGNIKNYYLDISGGGDVESEVNAGVISCRVGGGGDLHFKSNEKTSDAVIDINGGGDMEVEIITEKLKCTVSGGGDADLSGQATEFEIDLNGGGDVNAGNLLTKNTSFNISGGSDIRVNASQELSGYISGGGDVFYTGNPEKVSVDARGGSEVHKEWSYSFIRK